MSTPLRAASLLALLAVAVTAIGASAPEQADARKKFKHCRAGSMAFFGLTAHRAKCRVARKKAGRYAEKVLDSDSTRFRFRVGAWRCREKNLLMEQVEAKCSRVGGRGLEQTIRFWLSTP